MFFPLQQSNAKILKVDFILNGVFADATTVLSGIIPHRYFVSENTELQSETIDFYKQQPKCSEYIFMFRNTLIMCVCFPPWKPCRSYFFSY